MDPVSRQFGYDRGTPVDRYYIERFLQSNSQYIRGRVLEIGDDIYTQRFGGDRVRCRDIFHVHSGNPQATMVGDLATADTIPSNIFDCAIVTQTLQFIFDPLAALRTLHRILRPAGVLLATAPALTVVSAATDEWHRMWYWSFTPASIRAMVWKTFLPELACIETYGNILAGVCVLQGIAVEDVDTSELEPADSEYPVLMTIQAVKESG